MAASKIEELDEYFESGKNSLTIACVGKLGTGKSALVNGVIGRKVAKEGHSAFTETTDITLFEEKIEVSKHRRIHVKIWDTPGLDDGFSSNSEEDYIKTLADRVAESDLLLFCLDMRRRMEKSDMEAMKKLTEKAGIEIWKNAVFALTFANRVVPTDELKEDPREYFQTTLKSWEDAIHVVLTEKLQLSREIADGVSIVPTGYMKHCPPDRQEWFTFFWKSVFSKTKDSAQPTLLQINLDRCTTSTSYVQTESQPFQMNIFVIPEDLIIAVGSGIGIVPICTGAGALIGLAGGPLGVAIGAGVGTGVGIAVMITNLFVMKARKKST